MSLAEAFEPAPPLMEARGISKSYGANRVLDSVDFTLASGEAVALIGENGAGKSTFARILVGATQPDAGSLTMEGRPLRLQSPRDALANRIAFIPQELAYVPELTVAENVLLGEWPGRAGFTSLNRMREAAEAACRRFGISLDLDARMSSLTLADRQLAEIVKALRRRARIIVLDEPTAALNEQESRGLFRILGQLGEEGVGVIYISHRMDEVYRFSDRVDVFRNGHRVASERPRDVTQAQLIAHMLGQEKEDFERHRAASDEEAEELALEGWSREGLPPLHDVSLGVARGEILGVYGVRGSGADLVAEGLAGLHRDIRGTISLGGARRGLFRSPREARMAGLAYLPAERKRNGLVLHLPIRMNLTLMIHKLVSRLGILRGGAERTKAKELARGVDLRFRGLEQKVEELSGGNQQKILLASRLAARPGILVLHEPTRGVDVGARVEIHKLLASVADYGCATLMVTSDVEEAVTVSDRLVVIRDGRVTGHLAGAELTQKNAIALATEDRP